MTDTHSPQKSWNTEVEASLAEVEKYWLNRPGALTNGLRQVGEFSIEVLNEYIAYINEDEAYPLNLTVNQTIWVREILMSINGQKAVYARSITELTASRAAWQGIRALHARPLADILYNDPAISRSSFETTKLNSELTLQRSIAQYPELPQNELLARRSTFFQNHEGLTVNEVFLPGFWQELAKHPLERQISF
ncbi:MAG: chorismate lyase [Alcaligenaceae bacterium]|nr:chorismate lyase [Alcaligenaceae bacterium]